MFKKDKYFLIEPKMKAAEIKEVIDAIMTSDVSNKKTYFKKRYEAFEKKYPVLYEKACAGTLDLTNLDYMLGLLDAISDETTQYEASAKVGQMLYDKYVAPKLSTPDCT